MAKNQKVEIFKTTKEGKYIKQFGTLLIVSAVLTLGFMFLIFLSTMSDSDSASPFLFVQIVVSLVTSVYLLNVGPKIRRYEYNPQELKNKTVNVILTAIVGAITGIGVFLGGFIWIEASMLLRNWNKKYAQSYNTDLTVSNTRHKETASLEVVDMRQQKKKEEYEDDTI